MQNRFGVAMGLKFVAFSGKFGAIIGVIVNFAIVNNDARFVFIEHRLLSVRDINNAQTPMSESDIFINKFAEIVRTAMSNYVAHFC